MHYNLKASEVTLTEEIRAYLEKRLTTLEKFVHDPESARVDVELHFKQSEEKMYRAEYMLHAPEFKEPLRAEAKGSTLHEAIDVTLGELHSSLRKIKGKRLHFVRRQAKKVKDFFWRRSPDLE